MTTAEKWQTALSRGFNPTFSPSGHALAFMPLDGPPFMQSLEIHFADGREPRIHVASDIVLSQAWVSNTELVYRTAGPPPASEPTLHVLSVEDGAYQSLGWPPSDSDRGSDMAWSGRDGHLSILAVVDGRTGLFDLDMRTGDLERLTAYDAALGRLEVYPLFGHAWRTPRGEVALVAWPGDRLAPGEEPTKDNSQWSPMLDTPWIQDIVSTRRDGSRVTQRELSQEARRKRPPRLFLLDAEGGCREVSGTERALGPAWSPDGSQLVFMRGEGDGRALWLWHRADRSLRRIGGCGFARAPVMEPTGIVWYTRALAEAREAQGMWRQIDLSVL